MTSSTPSETAAFARAADWYAGLLRARATTVVDLGPDAWALLSPEWRNSFVHNGIVVRRDPGADTLVRWSDEVLGGAGLVHPHLILLCALSDQTRAGLDEAGYELQPELIMGRPGDAGPLPRRDDVVVEQVAADEADDFVARMWREEWQPGIGDDELRDLVSRRGFFDRSGPYLSYVVRDGGTVVASVDLAIRGDAAEVDGVATWPTCRGRGYGDALMAVCVDAAAEHGVRDLYLEALSDDWPRYWYQRRGWTDLGSTLTATRH